MLAEGAVVNDPGNVTGIVYRGGFGVVETRRQRQFMKSGLLGPQCGTMTSGCACNLPGFIDVGWP